MITLYHCADARSFRALWALHEIGLDYDLKLLAFPPRFQDRGYLDINPLGTVPFLIDGAATMSESAAIVEYLIARHAPDLLGVAVADADFAAYLNWLHFGEATLTFPQTLVLRYTRLEPTRGLEVVAQDYARWFLVRLRHVERALTDGRAYLLGDRFTGADISVGYALLLASQLKLDDGFEPLTRAYWQRLTDRPAYRAARAAQKGTPGPTAF
ncbi:glutathione S-transferase family protein [Novosphingobium sp.]|uniref:glutathione S-transferase family protein n=1 Tax=Novosphingobium sp. TaxID=1874826 RepID=UPI00333E3D8C